MNPDCVESFKTGISVAILNQFGGIVSSSYCCAFVCVFVLSPLVCCQAVGEGFRQLFIKICTSRLLSKMRGKME